MGKEFECGAAWLGVMGKNLACGVANLDGTEAIFGGKGKPCVRRCRTIRRSDQNQPPVKPCVQRMPRTSLQQHTRKF